MSTHRPLTHCVPSVHLWLVMPRHDELAATVPRGHVHCSAAASHVCAAGQDPQSKVSPPQASGAKPQVAWADEQVRGVQTARGGWEWGARGKQA